MCLNSIPPDIYYYTYIHINLPSHASKLMLALYSVHSNPTPVLRGSILFLSPFPRCLHCLQRSITVIGRLFLFYVYYLSLYILIGSIKTKLSTHGHIKCNIFKIQRILNKIFLLGDKLNLCLEYSVDL